MKPRALFWILFPLLLGLDQATKEWAQRVLAAEGVIPVLRGVFHLTYVRNTGIAFGMLAGNNLWLAVFAIGVIALAFWWARQLNWKSREVNFLAALLLTGAAGNLIDRLRYGYVVDFLDFHPIGYPWVFNIADSCITVSLGWIIARQLFAWRRDSGHTRG